MFAGLLRRLATITMTMVVKSEVELLLASAAISGVPDCVSGASFRSGRTVFPYFCRGADSFCRALFIWRRLNFHWSCWYMWCGTVKAWDSAGLVNPISSLDPR